MSIVIGSGITLGAGISALQEIPQDYLWAWGSNTYGKLGLGDDVNRSSPVQVGTLGTWAELSTSAFSDTMFAVKTDGTLWAWGRSYFGKLGNGTTSPDKSSPIQVGALTNWAGSLLSASSSSVTATTFIKSNGTLWFLGRPSYTFNYGFGTRIASPTQVSSDKTWASAAFGPQCWFGITTGGALWGSCYSNAGGTGGRNNTTNTSSPAQVGALTDWAGVYPGHSAVIARKTDGTLWSWGKAYPESTNKAFMGQNDAVYRSSPTQIGALTTWAKVIQTEYTVAAIKTNGTLWTWGWNSGGGTGALGLGDAVNRSSPTQVGALTNWLSTSGKFATGGNAPFMRNVKGDGTLWSWGGGGQGQTGFGDTVSRSSPVQLGSLTTWTKVGVTKTAAFAIASHAT